tara:strand:- start:98 stop:706 length:609 start_codon:yes stop_codon:yes gene_type:complete
MSYDFDEGAQGSGDSGPFLNWHAREKLDGSMPSRSFSLRTEGDLQDVTAKFKKGVAFDLDSLKTGWCFSNGSPGVSPEWKWNETPARFNVPQPDDVGEDRWKKGFSIRIAVDKETVATWSQAGAGAWAGLVHLMKAVKADGGEGETVIAALGEIEEIKFKKGGTSAPTFNIKKWADRPDCMTDQAAPEAEPEGDDGEDLDEF